MGNLDVISISTVLAWILIAIGFVSIFLPFAPGIPTIWFGIFLYAISHGFDDVSRQFMAIITAVAGITILLDYVLSSLGVQRIRAGVWGISGAIVGFILGSFIHPLAAYVIGPAVGAVIAENLHGHDQVFAFKTGNTTIIAFMGGTIIKLTAALAMIGLFVLRLQGKI